MVEPLLALGKLKRIRLACDEAISLYEKAEAIRPTFDGAFGLGTCLAVQQEDQKAIVQFKRALASDQRAAIAWEGLGTALARAGQVTEGIAALERAIALEPGMSEAYDMRLARRTARPATKNVPGRRSTTHSGCGRRSRDDRARLVALAARGRADRDGVRAGASTDHPGAAGVAQRSTRGDVR